ncbi:hypothetical protein [Streptomyces sp. bgisy029]|uniref:hypothetical protein n=1 Tax=Streptomyces sp. bgisy029 TaxID=3413771 RepID=UPI003D75DCE7
MSVDTTAMHTPLYNPETDGPHWTPPLDTAVRLARQALAEKATANIHNKDEMLRAAVTLDARLRSLIAALDKENERSEVSGA